MSSHHKEWEEIDRPLCRNGHMMLECVCGTLVCTNEFPDGTESQELCPEYDEGH